MGSAVPATTMSDDAAALVDGEESMDIDWTLTMTVSANESLFRRIFNEYERDTAMIPAQHAHKQRKCKETFLLMRNTACFFQPGQ